MMRSMRRGRAGGRGKKSSGADRVIVNSIKATGSGTTTVATDLVDRRQNMNLVQTPPKQIGNQIYWIKEIVTSTVGTSTTTFVENNSVFTLSSLADASTLAGVFDQYCIYSVAQSYHVDGNSPTGVMCSVLTALDYDNASAIGPTGIVSYSNCTETMLSPTSSLVRYIKPCIAVAAFSSAFTSFATQRCWLNCSSPGVQHFCIRAILLQTNAAFNVRISSEYVVGFRNKF